MTPRIGNYDDTDCELFCWHWGEVLRTVAAVDAAHGAAYGDEYRQQLAAQLVDRRAVSGPPAAGPGRAPATGPRG